MHKVFISTYIWNDLDQESATQWAALDKSLELPFAPFIGLEIVFDTAIRLKLERISWIVEDNCFHCAASDRYIDPLETERLGFKELIEIFTSNQWQLTGPYPNEQ